MSEYEFSQRQSLSQVVDQQASTDGFGGGRVDLDEVILKHMGAFEGNLEEELERIAAEDPQGYRLIINMLTSKVGAGAVRAFETRRLEGEATTSAPSNGREALSGRALADALLGPVESSLGFVDAAMAQDTKESAGGGDASTEVAYQCVDVEIARQFQTCTRIDVSDVCIGENPALASQGKRGVAIEGRCIEVAPGLLDDRQLCLHELTHIGQQRGGSPGCDVVMTTVEEAEVQADRVPEAVDAGEQMQVFRVEGFDRLYDDGGSQGISQTLTPELRKALLEANQSIGMTKKTLRLLGSALGVKAKLNDAFIDALWARQESIGGIKTRGILDEPTVIALKLHKQSGNSVKALAKKNKNVFLGKLTRRPPDGQDKAAFRAAATSAIAKTLGIDASELSYSPSIGFTVQAGFVERLYVWQALMGYDATGRLDQGKQFDQLVKGVKPKTPELAGGTTPTPSSTTTTPATPEVTTTAPPVQDASPAPTSLGEKSETRSDAVSSTQESIDAEVEQEGGNAGANQPAPDEKYDWRHTDIEVGADLNRERWSPRVLKAVAKALKVPAGAGDFELSEAIYEYHKSHGIPYDLMRSVLTRHTIMTLPLADALAISPKKVRKAYKSRSHPLRRLLVGLEEDARASVIDTLISGLNGNYPALEPTDIQVTKVRRKTTLEVTSSLIERVVQWQIMQDDKGVEATGVLDDVQLVMLGLDINIAEGNGLNTEGMQGYEVDPRLKALMEQETFFAHILNLEMDGQAHKHRLSDLRQGEKGVAVGLLQIAPEASVEELLRRMHSAAPSRFMDAFATETPMTFEEVLAALGFVGGDGPSLKVLMRNDHFDAFVELLNDPVFQAVQLDYLHELTAEQAENTAVTWLEEMMPEQVAEPELGTVVLVQVYLSQGGSATPSASTEYEVQFWLADQIVGPNVDSSVSEDAMAIAHELLTSLLTGKKANLEGYAAVIGDGSKFNGLLRFDSILSYFASSWTTVFDLNSAIEVQLPGVEYEKLDPGDLGSRQLANFLTIVRSEKGVDAYVLGRKGEKKNARCDDSKETCEKYDSNLDDDLSQFVESGSNLRMYLLTDPSNRKSPRASDDTVKRRLTTWHEIRNAAIQKVGRDLAHTHPEVTGWATEGWDLYKTQIHGMKFLGREVIGHELLLQRLAQVENMISPLAKSNIKHISSMRWGSPGPHGFGLALDIQSSSNPYLLTHHVPSMWRAAWLSGRYSPGEIVYSPYRALEILYGKGSRNLSPGDRKKRDDAMVYADIEKGSETTKAYFDHTRASLEAHIRDGWNAQKSLPEWPDSVREKAAFEDAQELSSRLNAAGSIEQVIDIWYEYIQKDQKEAGKGKKGKLKELYGGYLSLHAELVQALRDVGLAWGAVEISSGKRSTANGDIMHFDCRGPGTPIGRALKDAVDKVKVKDQIKDA